MSGVVKTLDYRTTLVRPTNIIAIGKNLYISDQSGWPEVKIFVITPEGVIKNYDCTSRNVSKNDLLLNNICWFLNNASGMLLSNDTLYIADAISHKIFSLNRGGLRTHIAGPWSYQTGETDGMGTDALFNHPGSITAIGDTLYVADAYNNRIRKITPDGNVTTFAGSKAGYADGVGTLARFSNPHGIVAVGKDLYVTDSLNNRIRKISPNGTVTTIAGSDEGNEDGGLTEAKFKFPTNITAIEDTLYVVDSGNRCIRKIDLGVKPTIENYSRKKTTLEELRTLPPMGIFPGGIEFQEAEKRFQIAQNNIRKTKKGRKTKKTRKHK